MEHELNKKFNQRDAKIRKRHSVRHKSIDLRHEWEGLCGKKKARTRAPGSLIRLISETATAFKKAKNGTSRDAVYDLFKNNMASWERVAGGKIDKFKLSSLRKTIQAYDGLGFVPGEEFRGRWLDQLNQVLQYPWNKGEEDRFLPLLTDLIRPLAVLRISPGHDFFEAYKGQLSSVFESASNVIKQKDRKAIRQLTNIFWALALMDSRYPEQPLKPLATKLWEILEPVSGEILPRDACQFMDACLWFDLPYADAVPHMARVETGSFLEKKVARLLDRAGMELLNQKKDCRVEELAHKMDMGILWKGKKIFIEVDGFSHFRQGRDGEEFYDGKTKFQSSLITKLNPDITLLRLRYKDFEALEKMSSQRKKLTALRVIMDQLIARNPGAYQTDFAKGILQVRDHLPKREAVSIAPDHDNDNVSAASLPRLKAEFS